jgi:cytochrome c553
MKTKRNKKTRKTRRPGQGGGRSAEQLKERHIRELAAIMERPMLRAGFKRYLEKSLKNFRKDKSTPKSKRYIILINEMLGFIRDMDERDFKQELDAVRPLRGRASRH